MVAHIETRTQEIQVITVYGGDYDSMRRKSSWCVAAFAFCLFGGILGIIPALIKSSLVDFGTLTGMAVLLVVSFAIALSSVFFLHKHRTLYQDLLLKNGWDPRYRHELKVDCQTFLHD